MSHLRLFLVATICLLSRVRNYDPVTNILDNDYMSDVEYLFETNNSFDKHGSNSIRKYYHQYMQAEVNLNTGLTLKCYVPSKLNREFRTSANDLKKIVKVTDSEALLFMKALTNVQKKTTIDFWYYSITPFKIAQQELTYPKKDENGVEYVEVFNIGTNIFSKFFDEMRYYSSDPDSFIQKYAHVDIPKDFFIYSDGSRILRVFNKKELKLDNAEITFNRSSSDGSSQTHSRKIVLEISPTMYLLDQGLKGPYFGLMPKIKQGNEEESKKKRVLKTNVLYSYKDYIHCKMCEFLSFYRTGDFLFLKNSSFNYNPSFTKESFQGRIITEIIDNTLLKVSESFDEEYDNSVRNGYIVLDSDNSTILWSSLVGSLTFNGSLVFGENTNFLSQINSGDIIFLVKPYTLSLRNPEYSTNPKFLVDEVGECVVEKVLSNSMLTTKNPCYFQVNSSNYSGAVFIGSFTSSRRKAIEKSERNTETEKVTEQKENLQEKDESYQDNKNIISMNLEAGLFDNYTPIIYNKAHSRYINKYIFHPKLILQNSSFSTLRLKLSKYNPKSQSLLRIILNTNRDDFALRRVNNEKSYEIFINSDEGILIKNADSSENIQFYDSDVKSLFELKLDISLVFFESHIYITTKVNEIDIVVLDYEFPDNQRVSFITFDQVTSTNVVLSNIVKYHTIEKDLLLSIYVYRKRLLLTKDSYYFQEMPNGDFCDGYGPRKTIAKYVCDESGINDLEFIKVEEHPTCVYNYYLKTKYMCNPLDIMRNKLSMGVAKTKCFVQNEFFNKSNSDIFN